MRSRTLFSSALSPLRSVVTLALTLSTLGCVALSSDPPPVVDGPFRSARAPLELDVPRALVPIGGDETFEMVFQDRDGEMFVGLIVDTTPRALDELDVLVEKNLKRAGYDGARVLSVEKARLGALPAHRSIIQVLSGERSFLMINTHASTDNESIQLVVWGLSSSGHLVRGLADSLTRTRVRFAEGTRAFVSPEKHALDDGARAFAFGALPIGWSPMRRGALREGASIELEHRSGGFFALALTKAHEGRPFSTEASALVDELSRMFDASLGDAGVSATEGTEPDVSWRQSGVLVRERVHVTYRVRLLRVDEQDVQVFCWGETSAAALTDACQQVIDAIEPRRASER